MILNPHGAAQPLPPELLSTLQAAFATGRFFLVVGCNPEGQTINSAVFASKDFPTEAIVPMLKKSADLALGNKSLCVLPATTPNGILRAG